LPPPFTEGMISPLLMPAGKRFARQSKMRSWNLFAILIVMYLMIFIGLLFMFNSDKNDIFEGKERINTLTKMTEKKEKTKSSLSVLLAEVQKTNRPIPDEDEVIEPSIEKQRCIQFSKKMFYNGRTKRRRIFVGSLIADDSWHVIAANALETYGIFHSVTFVESNRTQSFVKRALRFTPGSDELKLLQSGIFGPKTPVYLETFAHEQGRDNGLIREHMMRGTILDKWKELGMTRKDIGLIIDMDEIPSRDFLRAAQICEFTDGAWDTDANQTCRSPLVRMGMPMFEGSPKCIHKGKFNIIGRFLSSSMVIGACIEGIGDSNRHPAVPRKDVDFSGVPRGGRQEGYGRRSNQWGKMPNGVNGFFPLFNAADFRQVVGPISIDGKAGYHFHNFFDSFETIRFKYAYYGHRHDNAFQAPLGAINADLNLLVKCVHNISDEGNRKQRVINSLEVLQKQVKLPWAFQIEGYIKARHEELTAIVEKDEKEYGRADKFDGHHLYKEHMLTHKGRRHFIEEKKVTRNER